MFGCNFAKKKKAEISSGNLIVTKVFNITWRRLTLQWSMENVIVYIPTKYIVVYMF